MSFFFLQHPTEADLALFAGGEAGPLARWRIERHLDRCGSCRDVVADFFHLQSDLGELAEVPQLDWDVFARQIKAAAAQAESPAGVAAPSEVDAPTGWFGRPAAWGLGLASATAICGFVIFQQYSIPVETAIFSGAPKQEAAAPFAEETPGGPPAKESAARTVGELEEGLSAAPAEQPSDALELVDALAPIEASKRNVENAGLRQNRLLAAQDQDGESAQAGTDTEEVVARTGVDAAAVQKVRENFTRKAESLEHRRESDLRADKVVAVGNKRSRSAAAPDEDSQRKGGRLAVGGALALATEDRNEGPVEEGHELVGGEAPTVIRVASAGERGAQSALTKGKNLPRPAEKAALAEADYEPAATDAKQKQSAQTAPPASPPADRRESEQTPTLQAALETSEVAGVFRGGGDELRRAISQTETEREAKDDSLLAPTRDGDLSLLPVGLLDEEAEIGVAADGSMAIRTFDSATNTVTITHVYLP